MIRFQRMFTKMPLNIPHFLRIVFQALLYFLPFPAFSQIPAIDHVVIVVEENRDYSQIMDSASAPYIKAMASDSDAALFNQSFALTHPSQPNYLMLFSGSNQGITNDSMPKNLPFTADNLGASLLKAGKTFAGYSEDLPQMGFEGATSGVYARKHNPWVNWQNSITNGVPASANLPFTSFPSHFDSLPSVAFVIPGLSDDMHNGTVGKADTWLRDHMDGFRQWAKKNNGLLILTFDEGKNSGTNRIVTVFLGQAIKHGAYNEQINHYSVLRTLEDMFGLPHAANSATASPITDCWKEKTRTLLPVTHPLTKNTPSVACLLNPLSSGFRDYANQGVGFGEHALIFDFLGRRTALARAFRESSAKAQCIPSIHLSNSMLIAKSRSRP
jgi:phosphatidylinositol-3-phosphatase